jgi:F1F0 ATPase subunit 2
MTIGERTPLLLSALAGGALGAIFFGGLWLTVRNGLVSKQPAVWFLGSMLVRMAITLFGFFIVSSGHWERCVACLLGFMVVRYVVAWMTRPVDESRSQMTPETPHAS